MIDDEGGCRLLQLSTLRIEQKKQHMKTQAIGNIDMMKSVMH